MQHTRAKDNTNNVIAYGITQRKSMDMEREKV